jgi:hypothetical protein
VEYFQNTTITKENFMLSTTETQPDPYSAIETLTPKIAEILNEAQLEFPEVCAVVLCVLTPTIDNYLRVMGKGILISEEEARTKKALSAFLPHLTHLTNSMVLASQAIARHKRELAEQSVGDNVISLH